MTTLYQKDSKGNIRVWKIWIDDSREGCIFLCSESGIFNGIMIPCNTPVLRGLGGKTAYMQAEADMQTEINSKLKSGYVENILKVKSKQQTATIDKPAKGLVYHPKGKNDGYTIDKAKLRGKRVGVQVKLDGWRFRIWTDGNECIFYTSSGDIHIGFKQISDAILELFPAFSKIFGVSEVILDGEVYNHELGFQSTSSACGTSKHIDAEKEALRAKMQFYIFDIVGNWGLYRNRYDIISSYFVDGEIIMPVETSFMLADEIAIDKLFEGYLKEGYEGLIIRQLDIEYQHKKSKQFFKYKPLIDEEFTIVGFNKSITGDTLGSLILLMPDGREFDSSMKDTLGSDAVKQKIWDNRFNYLDKVVTVEFLEYTEAGIPRMPRAKCFRDKIDIC